MEIEAEEDAEDGSSLDEPASAYIWKYFGISAVDAKKGGNKHAICNFCARNFPACSTTRASAHILGRAVLGQKTAGINPCIPLKNKNDDRNAGFRAAQKDVAEIIRRKEMETKKRKQALMDDLLQPTTKSVESSPKIKTGAKELDPKIASFFMRMQSLSISPIHQFGTAFIMLSRMIEVEDEIHQLLHDKDLKALVAGIKACERNWSAHGHIHSRVRNKLAPETTETGLCLCKQKVGNKNRRQGRAQDVCMGQIE